jgi:beta-catenin-like protein 1
VVRLNKAGGLDVLLQAIAPYKGRDPGDEEEGEYLENLFDALCCCLLQPACRWA